MKNILIIGDSHTAKLGNCVPDVFLRYDLSLEYKDADQNYVTKTIENGISLFIKDYLRMYEDSKIKIWMSSHPGRSALNFDFENFASGTQKYILDGWNLEENIVMPWLGYIDIRNWLPQTQLNNYKSAEDVVSKYIDNVLNKFDKCRIIFIEPLPQFICIISNGWRIFNGDPDIEFELRYEQHLEFCKELRKQCLKRGLGAPIRVDEILGTDMIEPYMQPKKPLQILLNDHMTQKYYEKIVKHIAEMVY